MEGRALGYGEAIDRLSEALAFGIHPSLDGIRALTDALGRPQEGLRCVQITGTNGKTSVARMTAALLTAHGYRTGLYTSPHLISYTERMEVDGAPASEDEFAAALSTVFEAASGLDMTFTEFELLTAAAFVFFRRQQVEWAVLEVGMGGRWDATSVVVPVIAVITGIGLDHTERLGATREAIAADKAHIIKPGTAAAVLGPGCEGVEEIIEKRAREAGAHVVRLFGENPSISWKIARRPRQLGRVSSLVLDVSGARDYRVRMVAPSYQAGNIVTAMAAVGGAMMSVLDPERTQAALDAVTFPGRCELIRDTPSLIIDGAHNPQAAEALAVALDEALAPERPVIVLGILADKDAAGIVRPLARVASEFIATQNHSPRCMSADELAAVIEGVTGVRPMVEPSIEAAVEFASRSQVTTVVTGSLYTAGEARALFMR